MQNFLHCFLPLKVHLIFYLFSLFSYFRSSLFLSICMCKCFFFCFNCSCLIFFQYFRFLHFGFFSFFFQSLNLAYFITSLSHALLLISFSPSFSSNVRVFLLLNTPIKPLKSCCQSNLRNSVLNSSMMQYLL